MFLLICRDCLFDDPVVFLLFRNLCNAELEFFLIAARLLVDREDSLCYRFVSKHYYTQLGQKLVMQLKFLL